jgi:two-component system, NarL family, response regulator DesR
MGLPAVCLADGRQGSQPPAAPLRPRTRLRRVDGSARSHPAPVRTVIADDNAPIRVLLTAILELEPDFEVVATARDGVEAVSLAERDGVALLVLDLSMPGLDGLEVLERLRQSRPGLCVVVYSGVTRDGVEASARALGARDFLVKGIAPEELVERLRAALGG